MDATSGVGCETSRSDARAADRLRMGSAALAVRGSALHGRLGTRQSLISKREALFYEDYVCRFVASEWND